MNRHSRIDSIDSYLFETQRVLAETPRSPIQDTIDCLRKAWKSRNQVFLLGNGGSASTASHIANDLGKATIVPGKPRMKVLSLADNISLITAWANDTSYEWVFKEQLENLLATGDVVLGISASGNSPNVLRAMEFARRNGAVTIGWTGLSGGQLKGLSDYCVQVPTDDVGMIESVHMVIDHLIAGELYERIKSDTATWPAIREHTVGADKPQRVHEASVEASVPNGHNS